MGIKAYLLCGLNLKEEIFSISETINRNNLTTTPDILKFSVKKINEDYIFVNTINSCLVLCYYGEYENSELAYEDFYKDDENKNYDNIYNRFKKLILENFNEKISEADWCSLICVDEKLGCNFEISNNKIIIPCIDIINNSSLFITSVLDCSFVYQSIIRVSNFTRKLVFTKEISKFEQFKLTYYSQEVYKINKPELFLTNTKEIEIYKKVFHAWELQPQIQDSLALLNQSITNYSFLWSYNNNNSQIYVSSLLVIFTVLVGYSDLKSMVEDLFPNLKVYFSKLYVCILCLLVVRLIIIYLVGIYNYFKFKKNTKL